MFVLVDEAPLPVAPLRPRIGIEQIDARDRVRPAASRAIRPRRRDAGGYWRALRSSIATSALAMPLTNGSQPMKPMRGCACACAIRCSAPPKPISRRTSSTGCGNSAARLSARVRRDRARGAAAACRTAPPAARAADGPCAGRRMRRADVSLVVAHRLSGRSTTRAERKWPGQGPAIAHAIRRALRGTSRDSERLLQLRRQIGLLPREAAVLVGRAAEVAVGRGAAIDRLVELERAADVGRA